MRLALLIISLCLLIILLFKFTRNLVNYLLFEYIQDYIVSICHDWGA